LKTCKGSGLKDKGMSVQCSGGWGTLALKGLWVPHPCGFQGAGFEFAFDWQPFLR
jgi:hypothetical protein